jgi:hypothetical protein
MISAGVIAFGLHSALVFAQSAAPVPANLQAPAGNTAFFKGRALGTQGYVCLPTASGFAWTFFAPQATVFVNVQAISGEKQHQILTHFLSPNPWEDSTPRATWQTSFDSSRVWGRSVASSTDADYVAPGAIPWLLLEVVGNEHGPAGGAALSEATFVQRLNTSGGIAPATGCSEAKNVGSITLAPYAADYVFFKAGQ